jgi:hypothetical protein
MPLHIPTADMLLVEQKKYFEKTGEMIKIQTLRILILQFLSN